MFISKNYAGKVWPNLERQAMQARAFQEHQEYILPARFDDTPIPGVLPTLSYISLVGRAPEAFVDIIQRKLVNRGRTIPSESTRRLLFSTSTVPRVDPISSRVKVVSSDGRPLPGATIVAIADNNTTRTTQSGNAPKGLRARAERLADRRALDERIEQLEVANLFSYDLQAQRLRPASLRAIVAEKGCGKRRGSSTSILSR